METSIEKEKQQYKPQEPQTRKQIVKEKLDNLYCQIEQISPFSNKYGEILNEINNLEITWENIRHT